MEHDAFFGEIWDCPYRIRDVLPVCFGEAVFHCTNLSPHNAAAHCPLDGCLQCNCPLSFAYLMLQYQYNEQLVSTSTYWCMAVCVRAQGWPFLCRWARFA